jgi:hypothetical protein
MSPASQLLGLFATLHRPIPTAVVVACGRREHGDRRNKPESQKAANRAKVSVLASAATPSSTPGASCVNSDAAPGGPDSWSRRFMSFKPTRCKVDDSVSSSLGQPASSTLAVMRPGSMFYLVQVEDRVGCVPVSDPPRRIRRPQCYGTRTPGSRRVALRSRQSVPIALTREASPLRVGPAWWLPRIPEPGCWLEPPRPEKGASPYQPSNGVAVIYRPVSR